MTGISESFDRVAERSKRATQLGSNVNELGALQYAFGKGSNLNADATFDALRAMNKRISDAKDLANPLARDLDRIGLSAQQLETLGLIDRVRTIGEAIRQLPHAEDRAAMSAKFFEETGSNIVALFSKGDAALVALTKDYERLHGVISESEVESMLKASQAMDDVWKSIEGSFERIGADVGPAVADMLRDTANEIARLREFASQASSMGKDLGMPLKLLWTPSDIIRQLEDSGNRIGMLPSSTYNMLPATLAKPPSALSVGEAGAASRYFDQMEKTRKASEELAKQEASVRDAMMARGDALRESLLTPIEEAAVRLAEFEELYSKGAISYTTRNRAIAESYESAAEALMRSIDVKAPRGIQDLSVGLVERGSAVAFSAERSGQNTLKECSPNRRRRERRPRRRPGNLRGSKPCLRNTARSRSSTTTSSAPGPSLSLDRPPPLRTVGPGV